jgi:hypothetical protein
LEDAGDSSTVSASPEAECTPDDPARTPDTTDDGGLFGVVEGDGVTTIVGGSCPCRNVGAASVGEASVAGEPITTGGGVAGVAAVGAGV